MQTLSIRERLHQIEQETAEREAQEQAEAAFARTHPNGERNPWEGGALRLASLRAERRELELQLHGETLNEALSKKRELETRLDALQERRILADRQVAERAQHEAVKKYIAAQGICRLKGWGHSWELFRQWYETKRERYNAAPECSLFFLDSPQAETAGVRFDTGPERAALWLYLEAREDANRVQAAWNSDADSLRTLLQEYPVLTNAG